MALPLDYEKHIHWWYSATPNHKMLQYQHYFFLMYIPVAMSQDMHI